MIDVNAWQTLIEFECVSTRPDGTGLHAAQWLEYLQIIRELAKEVDSTPQLIDRWLYNYFVENLSEKAIKRRPARCV